MFTARTPSILASSMVGIVAVALVLLVSFSTMPLNHDAAVYLQCAQLLLQGKIPYVDYVELNPPMAHYLHCIPVLVAKYLRLDLIMTFQFIATGFVLASALALLFVLEKSKIIETRSGRLVAAAGWILFSLFVYASGSFGQREHLFILGYIPWLFCRESRYRGVPISSTLAFILALMMSFTALLKPHFVVLIVTTELWMSIRSRRTSTLRTPEVITASSIMSLYLVHFLFVPTPMRVAFFSRWLPFIIAHYRVYNNTLLKVLFLDSLTRLVIPFAFVLIIVMILFFRRRFIEEQRWLLDILIVSMMITFGIYVWQQKGWNYQLIPCLGVTSLLVSVAGIFLFEKKRSLVPLAACIIVLSFLPIYQRINVKSNEMNARQMQIVSTIQESTASTDRVVFISTNVYPAYPSLVYADRFPGTRYLIVFPVALLYDGVQRNTGTSIPYRRWEDASAEERQFLQELGTDIINNKPQLIFIDTADCQGCPDRFHIDEYLYYNGWAELYLAQYEKVQGVDQFAVLRRKVGERPEPYYAYLK